MRFGSVPNGAKIRQVWDRFLARMAFLSRAVLRPEGADGTQPGVERSGTPGKIQLNGPALQGRKDEDEFEEDYWEKETGLDEAGAPVYWCSLHENRRRLFWRT